MELYKAALERILDWPPDYEECSWPQMIVFIKAVMANDPDAFIYPEKLEKTRDIYTGPDRAWVEVFERRYGDK